MSMVELALRCPYTFIVMAMLIVLSTPLVLMKMATEIFPEIDIPVIHIIWNYNGFSAQEMGWRIASHIAAAKRAVAAANAQIGIARAAFYSSLMLASSYGVDSRAVETLFNAPSVLWSLGVSATQSLFNGGHISANIDFAKGGYHVTVANYRRVVLTAMQEAEDGITGMAALARAYAQAQTALLSARRVLELANSRYEGGVSTYLDVIAAQQALPTSERQAAQLRGQRMLTSVFLIKTLGGGWPQAQLAQK